MDFVALLDQVVALLRQRGRMTYRTLKRQFQLDDAALEDLKLELIKGQRLAVDEDGDVLVWMGAAGTLQEPAARPSPHAPPPATSAVHAPYVPNAERRQLTVLFCRQYRE